MHSYNLNHVSKIGVSIPKIRLLFLCKADKPVIAPTTRPDAVLTHTIEHTKDRQSQRDDLRREIDRVSDGEIRPIAGQVRPDRQDAARRPQGYYIAARDSPDRGSRRIIDAPGQEPRAAGESTHSAEVDGSVLETVSLAPAQQAETGDPQYREEGEVDAAQLSLVANIRGANRDQRRGHVHGYRVILCRERLIADLVQDRRQEHREPLHGDIDEEEAAGADVVVDVHDGALDVSRLHLLVRVRLVLDPYPLPRYPALPLREVCRRLGGLGKDEWCYDRCYERD